MVIGIRAHDLIHAIYRRLGKGIGTCPGAEEKNECYAYQAVPRKPTINEKARRYRNDGSASIQDSSNRAFDVRIHSRPAFPTVRLMDESSRRSILQLQPISFRRTCPILLAKGG